jgi:hypothetical protein
MAGLRFRGWPLMRDRALVMAIVNRTPDSFYDRGRRSLTNARWPPSDGLRSMARIWSTPVA